MFSTEMGCMKKFKKIKSLSVLSSFLTTVFFSSCVFPSTKESEDPENEKMECRKEDNTSQAKPKVVIRE